MKFLLLAAAASIACDPVYSLHLHAHITERGAPLSGAWVLGLNSDALHPPAAVRTGADGTADASFSAFLRNPAMEPLAIAARAEELMVALPQRDFAPRRKGLFFGKEWEATLELSMAPQQPELSLRCEGRKCLVDAPDLSCSWYELTIADSHAEGHLIEGARDAAAGRQRLSFTSRGGPPVVVVAVCVEGGKLRALVSNAAGAP
jgi:hypothetical protein